MLKPQSGIEVQTNGFVQRGWVRGLLALVDQAVVSFTNCLTIILLVRICDSAVFGAFVLSWQVLNYFRTANERCISAPYVAFAQRPDKQITSFLGSSLFHCFAFGSMSVLAVGFFSLSLSQINGMEDFSSGLKWMAIAIPFVLWRDHLRVISIANFRTGLALLMDTFGSILQFSALALMAYYHLVDIRAVALAIATSSCVPIMFWFARNQMHMSFAVRSIVDDWVCNWAYAKWLVIARCFGVGSYLVVPMLVATMLPGTPSQVAIGTGAFASCLSLVGLSQMFVIGLNGFSQSASVQAYHRGHLAALHASMWRSMAVYSMILVPICLLFFFFGSDLLSMIYKPSFAPFGMVVFALSINVLVVSSAIVASNGLAAINRPAGNFLGEFLNFVVSVATAAILIVPFGLLGAAIGITTGSLASALTTFVSFRRSAS